MQWHSNTISIWVVFYNILFLLLFSAECTESVLDIILYTESAKDQPFLGPANNFQNRSSLTAAKRYVDCDSCK